MEKSISKAHNNRAIEPISEENSSEELLIVALCILKNISVQYDKRDPENA